MSWTYFTFSRFILKKMGFHNRKVFSIEVGSHWDFLLYNSRVMVFQPGTERIDTLAHFSVTVELWCFSQGWERWDTPPHFYITVELWCFFLRRERRDTPAHFSITSRIIMFQPSDRENKDSHICLYTVKYFSSCTKSRDSLKCLYNSTSIIVTPGDREKRYSHAFLYNILGTERRDILMHSSITSCFSPIPKRRDTLTHFCAHREWISTAVSKKYCYWDF